MDKILPEQYQEPTPELVAFGVSLLEKIHDEIREGWNTSGMQLWLSFYIRELKERQDNDSV